MKKAVFLIYFTIITACALQFWYSTCLKKKNYSVKRDIYYIWNDAKLLSKGVNPYARIQFGNMWDNEKYTFYLPGFLIASATSIKLGLKNFQNFMPYWTSLNLLVHLSISLILFSALKKRGQANLGMLLSLLWFFGRWPLYVLKVGQIDNLAILFLVLSLLSIPARTSRACLLFGVSLAIKHVAAPLLPIFLICSWHKYPQIKTLLKNLALCLLVPALVSLPFIFWDAENFIKTLVFPLMRKPIGFQGAKSLLLAAGMQIQIIATMLLVSIYWLAWKSELRVNTAAFLCSLLVMSFNRVIFEQYYAWIFVMALLALFDYLPRQKTLYQPENRDVRFEALSEPHKQRSKLFSLG